MDTVVHSALEEICCEAANGLHLRNLWPKLRSALASRGLSLCPNVKRAIWENLVEIPGIKIESCGGDASSYTTEDLIKSTVEECEKLNVKIVASEAMRKSFLGIYEMEASESSLSATQRLVLERLAVARTNGIAQNELTKELRIPANNLFYQLKTLETQGLILRQPTVIRKKQGSSSGEQNNSSIVTTNMIYLYRYGVHLGCQQRLEIVKEDNLSTATEVAQDNCETSDAFGKERAKDDIHVKDFLPAMKAICDKLEKAPGKVLVVSDLKRGLGYRRTSGHRAWRNICHRLKDAQLVEECCTRINNKEVNCFRLLQSFSPSLFEPKPHGIRHDDAGIEQSMDLVKRDQITAQLVELPILRQIYDIIDAAGSKGLTNTEVCRKLGLCGREYHRRYFKQMISRFGLHLQLESQNRCEVYRVWTTGNFNDKSPNMPSLEINTVPPEVNPSTSCVVNVDCHEDILQSLQELGTSTSMDSVKTMNKSENDAAGTTDPTKDMTVEEDASNHLLLECDQHNSDEELSNDGNNEALLKDNKVVTRSDKLEMCFPAATRPSRRRSYPNYPRLTISAASSLREKRILEKLQEEKFLIKPELHRHLEDLENLEKERRTLMDRKTLERILNKLQHEGHCKCVQVSVPVLTNYSRNRSTEVILHPSLYNVSPELLTQIHEKMRSFEIRVRQQSHSKQKKSQTVPILNSVQRIPSSLKMDDQAERAEIMRANGFVPSKMVRAKLLHFFLWDWICSHPGGNNALLSNDNSYDLKNPHSTCKLFKLDLVIKSMPLELFLQVVGSVKKINDMVEKCKNRMLLCDFPTEEYKVFMDTRATGRLSWLIDILRRLKLIRLVSKDHAADGVSEVSGQSTTLTHALELKPYIEEPASNITSPGFIFPDLRPQVRHDFLLLSRKAVDEYWNTLEYCYATAKSRAALLAFPGSAVHEIFHSRAWAAVRVMTAEQRAELLKRMAEDEPNKKLSFQECKEIAKDLNLTLEQVLRVHYDKRQHRHTRFQKGLDSNEQELQTLKGKHAIPSPKRKRRSNRISSKLVESNVLKGKSSVEDAALLSEPDNQYSEEQYSLLTTTEDNDRELKKYYTGDPMDGHDVLYSTDDNDISTIIHKKALSSSAQQKNTSKRFSWTEESDRKLVMEYARYRAALGPKYHRVEWSSISTLPAPPNVCRRKMAVLNSYAPFRKAILKLCNMLGERYEKYLEKVQDKMLNNGNSGEMFRDSANPEDSLCSLDSMSGEWADFDDDIIKAALDDVLRHRKIAKLEAMQNTSSNHGNNDSDELEDCGANKASRQRSRARRRLPRKYMKLLTNGASVRRQMHESVAIANAVELLKLIFLSNSKAPEVPTFLAETLRRYSEHDLFAAFNYLREEKIMVGGSCNSPFVLSQLFLQRISTSMFPADTGKRVVKFASWLDEREKDLIEDGVDAPSDIRCGEVLTLCALVSTGEFSVTPCLPNDGVGEVEDSRTSKRKYDGNELDSGEISKKSKTSFAGEGEISSRREKGFPGIKLLLHREAISRAHAIESCKDWTMCPIIPLFSGKDQGNILSGLDFNCGPSNSTSTDCQKEILDSMGVTYPVPYASVSPWEAMTDYSKYLITSCSHVENSIPQPELFKTLYSAIQKSGDNGLSIEDIQKVLPINDDKILEVLIEVLEAFGKVLKVNAYNSVHVVDSLYRSKYFLTSPHAARVQTDHTCHERKSKDEVIPDNREERVAANENEIDGNGDEVHTVTILNLSEGMADTPEILSKDKITGLQDSEAGGPPEIKRVGTLKPHSSGARMCKPLLPWINGDGTTNEVVYKGLVRRVLGIVMQNPGMLEDEIICQMRGLNPQTCRQLLEMLIMDNHIVTRQKQQMSPGQLPSILANLFGNQFKKSKLIYRVHYFANPMSSHLL